MFGFDDKKKRILTISFFAYAIIFLLAILMMNFEKFNTFTNWLNEKLNVFNPIIIGAVIAYLCNPLVRFFQHVVLKRISKPTLKRGLSILLAYLLILAVIAIFAVMIIPQLISSINDLFTKLTDGTYLNMVINAIDSLIGRLRNVNGIDNKPIIDTDKIYGKINDLWIKFQSIDIFENGFQGVEIIGSYASKLFTAIKNIFFGFLLSVYFIINKDKIYAQSRKIVYALFSKKNCDEIYTWFKFADKTFGGFIVGKILDALFMIFVCSIAFSIAKIPYAVLIAVVIGVFNIIPFFGPFIGAVPSAFIILIASPDKFILFIVLLLVIQQIDANIVEPKIVGSRTGLSSLGVIVAIIIMSGYFGAIGMFFGVPLFAIIYSLAQKFVDVQLQKKKLTTDLADYYSDTSIVDPKKDSTPISGKIFRLVGKSIVEGEHKLVDYVKSKKKGDEDTNNDQLEDSGTENLENSANGGEKDE